MQLDPNIIMQAKRFEINDPMEAYGKALNLKQLANANAMQEQKLAKEAQMQELLKNNTKPDANGQINVDYQAASQQALQAGNVDAGMALQKQFQEYGLEKMKFGADFLKMALQAGDHTTMGDIKKQAIKNGVPNAEKLPDTATPEQYKAILARTLDIDKQLQLVKDQRDYEQKERELNFKRQERGDSLREKKQIKQQEKEDSLTTPYGQALTKDDAKNIKSADEEKKNFDMKIEEMITLRKKHHGGAVLNREDVARAKQLSKDALLSYKNMAKLGVLSQSDEAIINAIIPEDPLAYNSPLAAVQGQDPILNNLEKFKADSDADFQNRLRNRIKQPQEPGQFEVHDGEKWVYLGGDKANPKSWKKADR